jgi:hypothetical protein
MFLKEAIAAWRYVMAFRPLFFLATAVYSILICRKE